MPDPVHVTWHDHHVSRSQREALNGHRGCVVWFTGLSGSGKSTIANLVDRALYEAGIHTFLLDGDNVRKGLCASASVLAQERDAASEPGSLPGQATSNSEPGCLPGQATSNSAERFGLGFSADDRDENIRRVGAVAELFAQAGLVTLVALVSPYRRMRDAVRKRLEGDFVEVFVDAPLEVCEQRDPKGLYKKARAGTLRGMTGIDDPYEPPEAPELRLDAARADAATLAQEVVTFLKQSGRIG
jgi:adenylylsulfate kinase